MYAMLSAQSATQAENMRNRADLLKYMSQLKPAVATTDVWGQRGAYNIAKDTAELNFRNQQAMQKALDPEGFQIAEDTRKRVAQMVSPEGQRALANQMFTQRTLPGMYGTGFDPRSTIYGSGLFDANTLQGLELQQKLAGVGQNWSAANPGPKVGLDPGAVASLPGQENARAADISNAFMQNILSGAGGLQQSLEQGQNSLYSNLGQALQTDQANRLSLGQVASKNQWGNAASGAASGAAMGTMVAPGWGTAIGGLAGGATGYFS
jgi:hypothetical protein